MPRLQEGWTAQRLVEAGADSVKLLLYYSTLSSAGNEILCSREEAIDYYRRAAEEARVSFIYLSQEVNHETFQYALELAEEAEVNFSGVQCGRATWKDGVAVFVKHGATTPEDWLHGEGAGNIENVNKHLRAAQPWFSMNEELHSEKH